MLTCAKLVGQDSTQVLLRKINFQFKKKYSTVLNT